MALTWNRCNSNRLSNWRQGRASRAAGIFSLICIVSRASAASPNLNEALVLLPVCRHLITLHTRTKLPISRLKLSQFVGTNKTPPSSSLSPVVLTSRAPDSIRFTCVTSETGSTSRPPQPLEGRQVLYHCPAEFNVVIDDMLSSTSRSRALSLPTTCWICSPFWAWMLSTVPFW